MARRSLGGRTRLIHCDAWSRWATVNEKSEGNCSAVRVVNIDALVRWPKARIADNYVAGDMIRIGIGGKSRCSSLQLPRHFISTPRRALGYSSICQRSASGLDREGCEREAISRPAQAKRSSSKTGRSQWVDAFTMASGRWLTSRMFGQRCDILADQGLDVGDQKLD
jgi:hypothetical protein